VAVRAPGKAVVTGSVRGTRLVLTLEHADRHERVDGSVNHAADLEREDDERRAEEPEQRTFDAVHDEPRAYAIPKRPQPRELP
jgi:hypothetical protein